MTRIKKSHTSIMKSLLIIKVVQNIIRQFKWCCLINNTRPFVFPHFYRGNWPPSIKILYNLVIWYFSMLRWFISSTQNNIQKFGCNLLLWIFLFNEMIFFFFLFLESGTKMTHFTSKYVYFQSFQFHFFIFYGLISIFLIIINKFNFYDVFTEII